MQPASAGICDAGADRAASGVLFIDGRQRINQLKILTIIRDA